MIVSHITINNEGFGISPMIILDIIVENDFLFILNFWILNFFFEINDYFLVFMYFNLILFFGILGYFCIYLIFWFIKEIFEFLFKFMSFLLIFPILFNLPILIDFCLLINWITILLKKILIDHFFACTVGQLFYIWRFFLIKTSIKG